MTTIEVGGPAPYEVQIGVDAAAAVLAAVPESAARVAVLAAPAVSAAAARITDRLQSAGRRVLRVDLPDAEHAKTAEVAERCWAALGEAGFTRSDVVVGLGGGATTDLAGFVAATWLRGIGIVQVPTTLAGMVDAAIGGKTGINTAAGKNLVGAFHPPVAVVVDPDFLDSLPTADLAAGMAEVVKAGFIADPVILDLIEGVPATELPTSRALLQQLIERAIAVKASVVAADLTERATQGVRREFLNYGHTLGHAIERVEAYRWRHGDAVSVGLVFAAALSRIGYGLDPAVEKRHRDILRSLDLPVGYPMDRWDDLLDAMRIDKKARGRTLRFVVLPELGAPDVVAVTDEGMLRQAYAEVAR